MDCVSILVARSGSASRSPCFDADGGFERFWKHGLTSRHSAGSINGDKFLTPAVFFWG